MELKLESKPNPLLLELKLELKPEKFNAAIRSASLLIASKGVVLIKSPTAGIAIEATEIVPPCAGKVMPLQAYKA